MIEIVKYLNVKYSFFMDYKLSFLSVFWSSLLLERKSETFSPTCLYATQTILYTPNLR